MIIHWLQKLWNYKQANWMQQPRGPTFSSSFAHKKVQLGSARNGNFLTWGHRFYARSLLRLRLGTLLTHLFLISWKSKEQGTVSLSSAEAEFRSLRRLVAEPAWLSKFWLSKFLDELTVASITPIPVKCDSQAGHIHCQNLLFIKREQNILSWSGKKLM